MSRLSEKTIDELNDKVNFTKAFRVIDSLYEARSHLNDEVKNDLERLIKKLDAVTEGSADEEGEELFFIADELEGDIMAAQDHLERIYEVLSSITECWPDPDEEQESD